MNARSPVNKIKESVMAKCIKRGELLVTSHLTQTLQKLVLGSAHSLSSYQRNCIVMILSRMAIALLRSCATFTSFPVLKARLVRMHELVFLKMVAAEPVAAEL